MRKNLLRRMIAYSLILLGAYVALCAYLAHAYVNPIRVAAPLPLGLEEVTIANSPCWISPKLFEGGHPKAVFILAHGYGGSRASWSDLALRLTRNGYGVIVPSMPGHDASPDPACGFGPKEADLVVQCVRWADGKTASGTKIVAVGVSMGGAACWLACEKERRIDAMVSEGAFARFDDATNDWFRRLFPGAEWVLAPVRWIAQARTGVDPSAIRPMDAAAKWKGRPALVIQGANDRLIPQSHADRLASASGADLWIIPNCSHAQGDAVDPNGYMQHLESLISR